MPLELLGGKVTLLGRVLGNGRRSAGGGVRENRSGVQRSHRRDTGKLSEQRHGCQGVIWEIWQEEDRATSCSTC